MAREKKPIKVTCGGCYDEKAEEDIATVTMHINKGEPKNGEYARNLCKKCRKEKFYVEKIVSEEPYRKFELEKTKYIPKKPAKK